MRARFNALAGALAIAAAVAPGGARAQAFKWQEIGPRVYMNTCMGCHMANGEGVAGGFPSLVGHAIELNALKQGREYLIRLALFGLEGPIGVKGKVFDGPMPGWASLSDSEVAGVLNYVLNAWGNDKFLPKIFKVIQPAEIKAARTKPMKPAEVAALRATMIAPVARAETAPARGTQPVMFTADQAARGRKAYESACIDCHGSELNNGEFGGAPLTGSWFRNKWGKGSLAALYAYTKTRMPPDRPGTFNDQTYSELVAYILSANGYAAGERELTADPATLQATSLER